MKLLFRWSFLSLLLSCHLLPIDGQTTFMDDQFRPLFRISREIFLNFVGRSGNNYRDFQINLNSGTLQKQFTDKDNFFCDINGPGARNPELPTSVHQLRPGDIDIVGAMGDSLTAGNGGMATNILHLNTENKGISWSIGGQDTWRKFLTLPNILKEFNPNLYGYSLSDGISIQKSSRFNVAEIGAMSRDIPHQARVLVQRMKNDPNVDVNNHWKLITLMIGDNDYCLDICRLFNPEASIESHENELIAALRTIRDNLPRTFVNVVHTPALTILFKFRGKSSECTSTHYFECPCLFSLTQIPNRSRYVDIMEQWKVKQFQVANREEFQNRTDFTVVIQPFTNNLVFPKNQFGNTDFSYMSKDCFHFSQKGYARASNALWNNMLEPVGKKSQNWKKEFTEVKCPTKERPYLATRLNS